MRSIGSVYVTILADSKVFTKEAKDAAREAGDASGKAYSKEFNQAFADIEKSKEFDKLSKDIADDFHKIGKASGDEFGDGFKDARISKKAEAEIERIAKRFAISTKEVVDNITSRLGGAYANVERESEHNAEAITRAWDQAIRENERRLETHVRTVERAAGRWDNLGDRADRSLRSIRFGLRRAGSGGFFAGATSVLGAFVGLIGAGAKAVGAFVGVLADVGSVAGDVAKDVSTAGSAIEKMGTTAGGAAVTNMAALEEGMAVTAATAGLNLVPALIALGGLLAALPIALAIAAVAISALGGMLVILGSAITFIVGSVLALGPIFLGLGAAMGVLVVAVLPLIKVFSAYAKIAKASTKKEYKKAVDEFADALRGLSPAAADAARELAPVLDMFKGIAKSISANFFQSIEESLSGLGEPVQVLGDGLDRIAQALGSAVSYFVTLAQQPVFLEDLATLMDGLAEIVADMGIALGNFIAGFVSFFAALTPSAELLSGWLVTISDKFLAWVQSAEGKNAIKHFMEEAGTAASTFFSAVGDLIAAFATLFGDDGAQGDGQDFLQTIKDLAARFKQWVDDVSKDGRLQTWLETAKTTATDIWHGIQTLGQMFKNLNTPENQRTFHEIMNVLNGFLEVVNAILDAWNWLVGGIESGVQRIKSALDGLLHLPGALGSALDKAINSLHFATGGIVLGPTRAVIGDAGPEAVIPLARPLSQIDPSVRGMAAMIRGGDGNAQTVTQTGKVQNNTFNVYPVESDPEAVAVAMLNRATVMARG